MVASQYMSVVEVGSRAYGILYKVHDLHSGHFMALGESPVEEELEWAFPSAWVLR